MLSTCISVLEYQGATSGNSFFSPTNEKALSLQIVINPKKKEKKMAYKITDSCVACGTCAGECPVGAISEGDIYHIDENACISCGTCASVCPMSAIEEG